MYIMNGCTSLSTFIDHQLGHSFHLFPHAQGVPCYTGWTPLSRLRFARSWRWHKQIGTHMRRCRCVAELEAWLGAQACGHSLMYRTRLWFWWIWVGAITVVKHCETLYLWKPLLSSASGVFPGPKMSKVHSFLPTVAALVAGSCWGDPLLGECRPFNIGCLLFHIL